MWKLSIKTVKYAGNQSKKTSDQLLLEKHVDIYAEGVLVKGCAILPKNEDALAIGLMIYLGKASPTDQLTVTKKELSLIELGLTRSKTISPNPLTPQLNPADIRSLMASFQEHAFLYKDTGIAYSAALFHGNTIAYFAEDLSTELAVSKVLGLAYLDTHLPENMGLIVFGSITTDIVSLALRLGIHALISRTGITDKAYLLAKENNLLTICFCRGKHFSLHVGTLLSAKQTPETQA